MRISGRELEPEKLHADPLRPMEKSADTTLLWDGKNCSLSLPESWTAECRILPVWSLTDSFTLPGEAAELRLEGANFTAKEAVFELILTADDGRVSRRTVRIAPRTRLQKIALHKTSPGIPTEFPDLDRLIGGGLKPGEMFVLAARPSIGKTALALNIIRNIINREPDGPGSRKKVAFFSLEMTDKQIIQRLLCTEAKVPLSAIYEGSLQPVDTQRLGAAVDNLRLAHLFIDSTSAISVFELRAKARKMKELNGIDLIVIDYLQLMRAGDRSAESRQVEVAAISGGLKAIAKELNVPVLVLAQLSRESEKSTNPKENPLPKLSHLRESGAIEQDADVVVFLHRNRDESKEDNAEGMKDGIKSMLIVEKNRNGRTGIVNLRFIPQLMEFRCIEHKYDKGDIPVKKE